MGKSYTEVYASQVVWAIPQTVNASGAGCPVPQSFKNIPGYKAWHPRMGGSGSGGVRVTWSTGHVVYGYRVGLGQSRGEHSVAMFLCLAKPGNWLGASGVSPRSLTRKERNSSLWPWRPCGQVPVELWSLLEKSSVVPKAVGPPPVIYPRFAARFLPLWSPVRP